MTDLAGKTALVTGGTRGIGAAVARAFGRSGARLVLGYRADETSAKATVAALAAEGATAEAHAANLVHPDAARELVARCGERIDVLVHAAALGSFKSVLDLTPAQWDLTMSVNARAFVLLLRAAAEKMPRGASAVALSSLGSARVVPEYGAIGVSKAALEAAVRSLAVELGPRGVRVNALVAGFVEGTSVALHPRYEALRARAATGTPLGRLATPDDVAGAVLLLASPLAGWITGQCVVADGGAGLLL